MTPHAPYPSHWEADVVLRDGSTMRIRPIAPGDRAALQDLHMSQSERSQYFRFFAPINKLSEADLDRFTQVDHRDRVALVMVQGERIVAVGRYDRLTGVPGGPDVAEVAFYVADAAQGRGLGSILLEHLAAAGRERGLGRFVADVLPHNTQMLRVFSDAGYDVERKFDDGIVSVSFTIRPTDRSMEVMAERERRAEALSMRRILGAESVLVYGRGGEGSALAEAILRRIRESPFSGALEAAATPEELRGALARLPAPLDLAVVAASPEEVAGLVPALGEAGTGALLVPSGGFATAAGEAGVPQRELLRLVRRYGIRLVGPRSYGVLARGAHGALPAALTPATPELAAEGVGIFCQSSHAARALFAEARARSLPVASALAAGHRADVSGNDTMQYWAETGGPQVACIHLESIGNPRKFSRVARHLGRQRPVIATIAGSTGQVRPPGHPVRASRAPRRALEELMNQAGVLRARSVAQQLDWATALISQPLPRGDRVAVVANSGTHLAVLHELLTAAGAALVGGVRTLNPVAGPEDYSRALGDLAGRQDWDAALVSYGPFLDDDGEQVAAEIARFAAASQRTVLAQVHGMLGLTPSLTAGGTRVPGFTTGEDAIDAWAAMRRYATRQTEPGPKVDPGGIDRRGADAFLTRHLEGLGAGHTARLPREAGHELLAHYGLRVLPSVTVRSVEEALAAAREIGWPVALKTGDAVLRHRADLGGVRLDVTSEADLRQAYAAMSERMRSLGRAPVAEFDVQAMAPTGVACVVRAEEDPLYGPIVSFGLGGDATELLGDVSYRVPPLTESDARALVTSVKAAPRLLGYRSLPPLAVDALIDVVERVSVLKEERAGVASVVLNPVLVAEETVSIISAEVHLSPPERGDYARRALP